MKRKIHFTFVGLFMVVIALKITVSLTAGQTFMSATWSAFSEIRLMEYGMFAFFWYACAMHRPQDDWQSSLITLNLARSNDQK